MHATACVNMTDFLSQVYAMGGQVCVLDHTLKKIGQLDVKEIGNILHQQLIESPLKL